MVTLKGQDYHTPMKRLKDYIKYYCCLSTKNILMQNVIIEIKDNPSLSSIFEK